MSSTKKQRTVGEFSSVRGYTYEVFISFTGVDTRNSFVSHLYEALNRAGIVSFKDDMNLEKGTSIAPDLNKAIEESRSAVVIFSKHYADSSWCLNELDKILECEKDSGMKVYPVFYDVDPSQVRKQTGDYETAFLKHKVRFSDDQLQKWKEALTKVANNSGWDVAKIANGGQVSEQREDQGTK